MALPFTSYEVINRLKSAEPEYRKVLFARLICDFGQVQISSSASIVTMYIIISSEIVTQILRC